MTRLEEIRDAIKAAFMAAAVSATPFPQRRHDERGWQIGHVLNGIMLRKQCSTMIPHNVIIVDDYVNAFVAGVLSCQQSQPLLSARLPDPVGYTACHEVVGGFSLRFINLADAMRVDVVVG